MILTGDTQKKVTQKEVEPLAEDPRRQPQERTWLERAAEVERTVFCLISGHLAGGGT
jgi:hypothetical protein